MLTMELLDRRIKVVVVEMLINGLRKFDNRLLLNKFLLCCHCDVCARQQDSYTDKQYKLHTHTQKYTTDCQLT